VGRPLWRGYVGRQTRDADRDRRRLAGALFDLLFPINHGILYYPGYDVLPPFVVYKSDKLDEAGFEAVAARLRERMSTLATTPPIAYRRQNGGDYLIPDMRLRSGLEDPGVSGFALHVGRSQASHDEPDTLGSPTEASAAVA
jgi:NAD(P)H dehydrogenase (quinone)